MNTLLKNAAIFKENQEEIVAFPTEQGLPLCVRMAGITHPNENYRIERSKERNGIFVFEYCIEGCGHLTIDGKAFSVKKGDTYILTPHTDQCYYADKNDPYKKIWVNVESTYLDALLSAHGLSYGVYHYNAMRELDEILALAKSTKDCKAATERIAPILLSLIQSLSMRYERTEDLGLATIIREHIESACCTHFSPATLARALHISLSTMTRVFLCAYGCTPYEYYLRAKEKMAKTLLQNTGLSAKEIAYRLGFSDEHYFSNFFKKRTGLRPIEYKECRLLE